MLAVIKYSVIVLFLSMFLQGCSGDNERDVKLKKFMHDISLREPKSIKPIPKFVEAKKYAYAADTTRNPFAPPVKRGKFENRPDTARKREPLEAFPLDGLRMVGTMVIQEKPWALVQAPNKTVHRVTQGQYMGQNYGRIEAIERDKLILLETLSDGSGGWQKHKRVLTLVK